MISPALSDVRSSADLDTGGAGAAAPRSTAAPTVWGLSPWELHDRFWASRGVQVVRQGEPSEIVAHAELFLLTDVRTLCIFKLARPVEHLSWVKPDVLFIRLRDGRERGYGERAVTDQHGRFARFERIYGGSDSKLARVALTPDRRIAQIWQTAADARTAWRLIRAEVPRSHRSAMALDGSVFDRSSDAELMQFLRELMVGWKGVDSTVGRATRVQPAAWADENAQVAPDAKLIGPVWVGAGRKVPSATTIVGPAVLWDDPSARPPVEKIEWQAIEPSLSFVGDVTPRQLTSFSRGTKRLFDLLFALGALAITLPLYPLIMLAIWLEDGRPFFFVHKRETMGGRQFGCIKFRSMRKNAEEIKRKLLAERQNQADGPQFFMDDDPRLTLVGKFIRKANIDELPQFINVLLGHMSVVGPRPSPFAENQYCPPWREARLSVRPGVTGLWQVRRTRVKGLDFQEWIKYDIEYVENLSWRLDLWILWQTVRTVVKGLLRP